MGLRIILVGVVAGLGLTLPTAERVGEWEGAARAWISAKLTEADDRAAVDEDFFLVDSEPPTTVGPAPATPAAVVVESVKAPVATPAELADRLDAPTAFDEADAFAFNFEFVPDFDLAASILADALPLSDALFDAAQDEFVAVFVADRAATAVAELLAAAPAPAAPALVENPDAAFDSAQNEFVAVFVASEKVAETKLAEVVRPEAVEADENFYSGLAYELNLGAEGLEPTPALAPEIASSARPSDRDGRLTHAVRLTRDAVHAWANLLHGPAIVTIGR